MSPVPDPELLGRLLLRAGVPLLDEMWVKVATDRAECDRRGKRSLADTPGAQEARQVVAADVEGRRYSALRVRGQKPRLAGPAAGIDGAVLQSLAVIAAVVAGRPVPEMTLEPFRWEWPDAEAVQR